MEGGIQTFEIQGDNGETDIVTVEELSGTTRISNGTYLISYTSTGAWKASFKVNINGNKITNAYSPSHKTVIGSILTPTLIRNSSTKASYSFVYKTTVYSISTGVRGYISGTTLKVAKI